MEKILLLNIALLLSTLVNAQKVIEQPQIGMTTSPELKIEKIVLSDTATVICFHHSGQGGRIVIPHGTYLLAAGSSDTLFIKSTEGIPINKQFNLPSSGGVSYKLIFPRIDLSVSKIDYGETGANASWFIYDIRLQPDKFVSMIPEKISGNWFRSDNGQWTLTLLDSAAVYKSLVWKFKGYEEKNGIGQLKLNNGSKNLTLTIKQEDNGDCLIGESPVSLTRYTRELDESRIPADKATFQKPVFKADTAVYCGYIKGFSPRYGQRTGTIILNNLLLGQQINYSFKIDQNGNFRVKIPMNHPQMVLAKNPLGTETLFLEPKKSLFHFISSGGKSNNNLFMGENARVNSDLCRIKALLSFNPDEMREKILDFTPGQCRDYCEKSLQHALNQLKDLSDEHRICAKAAQLTGINLNCLSAMEMVGYRSNYQMAYYAKESTNTPTDIGPDISYYSFLTPELINNPVDVMTTEYFFLIGTLKRTDLWIKNSSSNWTTGVILEKFGEKHALNPEEAELVKLDKEYRLDEIQNIRKEFNKRFRKQMNEFMSKHMNQLRPYLMKNTNPTSANQWKNPSYAMQWDYLKSQKVGLTKEDSLLFENIKSITETTAFQRSDQILDSIINARSKIKKERLEELNKFSTEEQIMQRNEELIKLGISSGLMVDLLNSQDFLYPLELQNKLYSEQELKAFQQKIGDPFIKSYLKVRNQEINATELAIKTKILNETPKTEPAKVFDAIMNKYKGKIIFVDFWATWCGPCRAGIEKIFPLKEEMSKENVVFVYLSNQSSPITAYNAMIPNIRGEHYRLSANEWNTICDKFDIHGIPRYILVGKNGKVIDSDLAFNDNKKLKDLLMKYIKE